MPDKQPKPALQPVSNEQTSGLRVADIVKHLTRFADMHKDARTGNPTFSEGLREFAKSLKPYARWSLAEFADVMHAPASAKQRRSPTQNTGAILPPNLESLQPEEIEKVIGNGRYAKFQLIEIGAKRFGIPRSQLSRRGRNGVLESINAALAHERSLDIIAQEARRSGENRSS